MTTLGVLGNLLFIIGVSYTLNRQNKIRALKYAEYTVSSKNFSCELNFDDDHFDYLCYDGKKKEWYQMDQGEDKKKFEDENQIYSVKG